MWPEDEPTATTPALPDHDPFDPSAPTYESVSLASVRESLLFEAAQRARMRAKQVTDKGKTEAASTKIKQSQSLFN